MLEYNKQERGDGVGLSIITGRAGSGKSRFLMAKIKELLKNPYEKIIVIVPGQLTFDTEKRIMEECGTEGFLGAQVLSITRLALKILDKTGAETFLSNAQKAVACHLALLAFDSPFGGAGHLPDFEICLAELFTRLKSYCHTPQSIKYAAERTDSAVFGEKLSDIAKVYEKYTQICESRADTADMYILAAEKIKQADLRDAYVFIDGMDSFSPAVMILLRQLMALSKQTYAAFRAEGDGADSDLFASEKRDMDSLISAAAGLDIEIITDPAALDIPDRYGGKAIKFLEENLYSYPYTPYRGAPDGIRIIEANDIEQEVKALAANIIGEVQRGKRFRDIAVAVGAIDKYLPAIKSVFAQCGISYFIDERRRLSENTYFSFLYSALCAAAGDYSAVEGYVFSEYSPISVRQRTALKSYTRRYALKGWHYYKKFIYGSDAREMESIREEAMRSLNTLAEGIGEIDPRAQINSIYGFLDECSVCTKIEALCENIDEAFLYGEKAYLSQLYDKSIETLGGIASIAEGSPVTPKTLCGLVKTGFESVNIAVIPPATDEVAVYDISVARLPGIDALFAVGVHDGVWPSRDDTADIIPAAQLEIIYKCGVDIGLYDPSEQKLKVYTALAKPKERLVLSYNTQTGQPSIIIDRIKRLFPKLAVEKPDMPLARVADIESEALLALAETLRGKEPDDKLLSGLSYRLANPKWRNAVWELLLRTNAAMPLDDKTASALYGGMRCSATRIENYYKCPYKHFLDYGLKLKPKRDYVHDRIDIGSYMHFTLDLFTKKLLCDSADIKKLTADETEQRMIEAANAAAEQYDNGKLLGDERFALLRMQLEKELIDTAKRVRSHMIGSGASIYASELIFENEVETEDGVISITGKIDRIDNMDGYFRVVDYKSSKTKPDLDGLAAGTSIQLAVYIDAAKRTFADLEPAGGYYMRIGEKYCESAEQARKDSRMMGISLFDADVLAGFSSVLPSGSFSAIDQALTASGELNRRGAARLFSAWEFKALLSFTRRMIKEAAKRIYRGDTQICPTDKACEYCDYGSICRFNTNYTGNTIRETAPFDRTLLSGECDNGKA